MHRSTGNTDGAEALYFEDFTVGQQFRTVAGSGYTISRASAVAFAHEYDPQNQHLDDEGAKESLFGKLIVSGWQTAAITMRLKTQLPLFTRIPGGVVGMGLDYVKWPRPVLPGDTLSIALTLLELRKSNSMQGKGIAKYQVETFNQHGEVVMEMRTAVVLPCRP